MDKSRIFTTNDEFLAIRQKSFCIYTCIILEKCMCFTFNMFFKRKKKSYQFYQLKTLFYRLYEVIAILQSKDIRQIVSSNLQRNVLLWLFYDWCHGYWKCINVVFLLCYIACFDYIVLLFHISLFLSPNIYKKYWLIHSIQRNVYARYIPKEYTNWLFITGVKYQWLWKDMIKNLLFYLIH